jgi:hypothetical protein
MMRAASFSRNALVDACFYVRGQANSKIGSALIQSDDVTELRLKSGPFTFKTTSKDARQTAIT